MLIRTIAITIAASVLLAACSASQDTLQPVSALPTTAAACEALRPDMPIRYSGKQDTAATVRQVRSVNARYAAACP